jgi:hypothetical protein
MKPTRPIVLVVIALACAGVTWAILEPAYRSLPALPWTMVPALLVAAGAEAWSGRDLRQRIRGSRSGGTGGPGSRPLPAPHYTTRLLALAKASSLAGAVIGGVAAGFVFYTSGSFDVPAPRHDFIEGALTFGACLILVVAALYLEDCCRVPPDPDARRLCGGVWD